MSTQATVTDYFEHLEERAGWEAYIADDVVFTSLTSPNRSIAGKQTFLQATTRFYGSIAGVEVRELLVDGDRACALTRYVIKPANGAPSFESDVAELFTVDDGKITKFTICFDSAPYPK